MIFIVPADPTTPVKSLRRLRAQAKRSGHLVNRDRYANTYSLIDARLRVPLFGFDHVASSKSRKRSKRCTDNDQAAAVHAHLRAGSARTLSRAGVDRCPFV
jgi:hypothetical protein